LGSVDRVERMSVVSDSGKTHLEEKIALGRIRAENFGGESHGGEKISMKCFWFFPSTVFNVYS
jgi:hypothetical protein